MGLGIILRQPCSLQTASTQCNTHRTLNSRFSGNASPMSARRGYLHGEGVSCVGAAVDDVEGGNGEDELLVARQVGQVLVQRHILLCGSSLQPVENS